MTFGSKATQTNDEIATPATGVAGVVSKNFKKGSPVNQDRISYSVHTGVQIPSQAALESTVTEIEKIHGKHFTGGGTTLMVTAVSGNHIRGAHVGDCRAITVSIKNKQVTTVKQLNKPHTPLAEEQRIVIDGVYKKKYIESNPPHNNPAYVGDFDDQAIGCLSVSRTIGDMQLKASKTSKGYGVIADPESFEETVNLTPEGEDYFIQTSDGYHLDEKKTQQAIQEWHDDPQADHSELGLAQFLKERARKTKKLHSSQHLDDISIWVTRLKQPTPATTTPKVEIFCTADGHGKNGEVIAELAANSSISTLQALRTQQIHEKFFRLLHTNQVLANAKKQADENKKNTAKSLHYVALILQNFAKKYESVQAALVNTVSALTEIRKLVLSRSLNTSEQTLADEAFNYFKNAADIDPKIAIEYGNFKSQWVGQESDRKLALQLLRTDADNGSGKAARQYAIALLIELGFIVSDDTDDQKIETIISNLPNYNTEELNILAAGIKEYFAYYKHPNPNAIIDSAAIDAKSDPQPVLTNDYGQTTAQQIPFEEQKSNETPASPIKQEEDDGGVLYAPPPEDEKENGPAVKATTPLSSSLVSASKRLGATPNPPAIQKQNLAVPAAQKTEPTPPPLTLGQKIWRGFRTLFLPLFGAAVGFAFGGPFGSMCGFIAGGALAIGWNEADDRAAEKAAQKKNTGSTQETVAILNKSNPSNPQNALSLQPAFHPAILKSASNEPFVSPAAAAALAQVPAATPKNSPEVSAQNSTNGSPVSSSRTVSDLNLSGNNSGDNSPVDGTRSRTSSDDSTQFQPLPPSQFQCVKQ